MKTIFYPLSTTLTMFAGTALAQHDMGSMTQPGSAMMSMADATKSLESLKGSEFDIAFLKEMIGHHRSALEMSKLVSTHTQRPELNKLAGDIIVGQQKQIAEMSAWLQTWYGQRTDETVMAMPGMDKLAAAKDAEFDKLFVPLMAEHHQGALDMAKLVAVRTNHTELKTLAATIIDAQTQEIGEMNGWKQAWSR